MLSADFIGGLIVGEGSYGLYIVQARKTGYITIKPGFSLRMNDLDTIQRLCEAFDFYGLPYYRGEKLHQRCATVQTAGLKRMRKHLDFMLPYLTGVKLEAAQVVDRFVDKRLTVKQPTPYDEQDIESINHLRSINGPNARRISLGILRDYTLRANKAKI